MTRKVLLRYGLIMFTAIVFNACAKVDKKDKMDEYCLPVIQRFFAQVANKDHDAALEELLSSNRNINRSDSSAIRLTQGFKEINELSGKYLGYKLLKKRVVADDIAIYSCLVEFETKFYRYTFIFYKTGEKTRIYKFSYDDTIALELEESLKLYTQ